MPRKNQHVHRYERVILGKNGYTVFRCNLPDCSHYIAQHLAKGKLSICNRCGGEFILDTRAMKLEKPHCTDCIKTRKKESHDTLLEFIEAHDSGNKLE